MVQQDFSTTMENTSGCCIASALDNGVIFLTGGTGMLGMAFLAKVVLSTDVACIYVLARGGEERFWRCLEESLPYTMTKELQARNCIEVLEGDITKPDFGLEEETIHMLQREVTIFVHGASTINLKHPLEKTMASVVRPSLAAGKMALTFKALRSFVYVSTAYVNAFRHWLPKGTRHSEECVVEERVYPLRAQPSDDDCLREMANIEEFGTTPEWSTIPHPYAYSYCKHLTERLLLNLFETEKRSEQLLIIRPSVFAPAQQDPYPFFELSKSVPKNGLFCAMLLHAKPHMLFSTNLEDPSRATIDEVPVDVVVNRMIAHIGYATSGPVHAVSGPKRRKCEDIFQAMRGVRRKWWLRPSYRWIDGLAEKDKSCTAAKLFRICGCSFDYREDKTQQIWELMDNSSKEKWPLWTIRDPNDFSDYGPRGRAATNMLADIMARRYGRIGKLAVYMISSAGRGPDTAGKA